MSIVALKSGITSNKNQCLENKIALNLGLNHSLFSYNKQTQNAVNLIITHQICKIALGLQPCLYVSDLFVNQSIANNPQKIDLLKLQVQQQKLATDLDITLRQFITITFAYLGVEVAYSGKNQHEKGVIIDVDEDIAQNFGLSLQTLKQGQTVVKTSANNYETSQIN